MVIDWGQAVIVGVVGFSVVFLVLVILAGAIWLTGYVVTKMTKKEEAAVSEGNGTAKS